MRPDFFYGDIEIVFLALAALLLIMISVVEIGT